MKNIATKTRTLQRSIQQWVRRWTSINASFGVILFHGEAINDEN